MSIRRTLLIAFALAAQAAYGAGERVVVLDLQRIQCYGCMQTVKKALDKVSGVREITLDLDKKTATVKVDSGVPVEALTSATARAGFPSQVRR